MAVARFRNCPKCECEVPLEMASCPRCGIVFAKAGGPPARSLPAPGEVGRAMQPGLMCDICRRLKPTAFVELKQSIGAIVWFIPKTVRGHLCAACAKRFYREFTRTTALIGWVGVPAIFVAPAYVIGNTLSYRRAMREIAKQPAPVAPLRP